MCKMCERVGKIYSHDSKEFDFGVTGAEYLSVNTYREDDKSPMEIYAALFINHNSWEDRTIEVGIRASYCPFCGRKLS